MRLPRRRALHAVLIAGALFPAAASAGPLGDRGSFAITRYWFVPETRFVGATVAAPGLAGTYREDFLYSAAGVPMQGTGTALDGSPVHWAGSTGGYWVNVAGARTDPGVHGWSHGPPYWRDGGWRNADGAPTFRDAGGAWSKGTGTTRLAYHDRFGSGAGAAVTPWHSIATDTAVIPRGTHVYIPALRDSPAHGCFVAEDTGGAIIGQHIDVLVPADSTFPLPGSGNVIALGPQDVCPPPAGPVLLGPVAITYLREASGALATGLPRAVPGVAGARAPSDLLYGRLGVVRMGVGQLANGTRIVADGGGWWVNRKGRRTAPLGAGWSNGRPYWRDGGWRNAAGAPTWRLAAGGWSNGSGVVALRSHDRFHLAAPGERAPWHAAGSSGDLRAAVTGSLLQLDALPSAGCLQVDWRVAGRRGIVEITVPLGTDVRSLPRTSVATALPAGADPSACAN